MIEQNTLFSVGLRGSSMTRLKTESGRVSHLDKNVGGVSTVRYESWSSGCVTVKQGALSRIHPE